MLDLKVAYENPINLTTSARNARTHSPFQIGQIADSIRAFGFTNPLLVDEDGVLIAGHGRLAAARLLEMIEVPVIRLLQLSETQKRALMLADNKIAANAGWDERMLHSELADLSQMDWEFDICATGFDVAEIDLILEDGMTSDQPQTEIVELPNDSPAITQPGDLWRLGSHRVLCADARERGSYEKLLEGNFADAGFTDPPYNVRIDGHVTGKGAVQHREFAMASGEMSRGEFTTFLQKTLGLGAAFSRDGAVWFTCMDWRHFGELLAAAEPVFETQLNLCVWAKTNGGMGSLYRSQHELVAVFRKGKASHRNNVRLGKHGRNRTNVWLYAGVNTFRKGRMEELQSHPTAKPVDMVCDALLDVTKRGDLVLDPFLGAGAAVMAAESVGRRCCGLEIDARYVDVILRRWCSATGEDPLRASDGASFSELEERFREAPL